MFALRSPAGPGGAGRKRRVRERAVAMVDPQLVLVLVVGHEDVDPTVAVEVGGRDSKRRTELTRQPGGDRHVREATRATIAIQPAGLRAYAPGGNSRRGPKCRHKRCGWQGVLKVVADEEIEPAVAIEVDEARRTPHDAGSLVPLSSDTSVNVPCPVAKH
jgi:hypothetical protein